MRHRNAWILCGVCVVGAILLFATRPRPDDVVLVKTPTSQTENTPALVAGRNWLARGTMLVGADPSSVVFSPSGRWCVGQNEQLSLWDARTGVLVRVLLGRQPSGVGSSSLKAYFIGENDLVVVTDHNVLRLDLSGRVRRRYFGGGTYIGIFSPAILPDKREIALEMDEPFRPHRNPDIEKRAMRRLNLKTGQLSVWKGDFGRSANLRMAGNSIALSNPGVRVFLLDANKSIKWSRRVPFETPEEDRYAYFKDFKDFTLSANGKNLFVLPTKAPVSQVDTRTLKETNLFPSADFTRMALSPNERFLVLGSSQGRVAVYRLKTRQLVRQVVFPFPANDLVFSPDGKRLAIGGTAIVPFDSP